MKYYRTHYNNWAISFSNCKGLTWEGYLFTTFPSLSIKNFSKFHFTPLKPRGPDFSSFKKVYRGDSSFPLTLIFFMIGNVTLNEVRHIDSICSSFRGSWLPNWLQGNPMTTKSLCWYCCQRYSNSSYWGVNPHSEATLTIRTTLPRNISKLMSLRWVSSNWKSYIVVDIVSEVNGRYHGWSN